MWSIILCPLLRAALLLGWFVFWMGDAFSCLRPCCSCRSNAVLPPFGMLTTNRGGPWGHNSQSLQASHTLQVSQGFLYVPPIAARKLAFDRRLAVARTVHVFFNSFAAVMSPLLLTRTSSKTISFIPAHSEL